MEWVDKRTAEILLKQQPRCVNCSSTYNLEIHHRIFRSEWEAGLKALFKEISKKFEKSRCSPFQEHSMHSISNLVVLCRECHWKIHNWDRELRDKFKYSYTSRWWRNAPYVRPKRSLY